MESSPKAVFSPLVENSMEKYDFEANTRSLLTPFERMNSKMKRIRFFITTRGIPIPNMRAFEES